MSEKRNFSAKREAVYRAISTLGSHPSAEQIYEYLKADIPDLSLGTVYRNLSVFKQNGKIRSVGVFNGQERFDSDMSAHSHFVCERCYAIYDIPFTAEMLEKSIREQIEREYGAEVKSHSIVFYGICRSCKKVNC